MEEKETKILILVFLLEYERKFKGESLWSESIETFNNLDIDWWVKPQGASHLGLAYQSILDTDDLDIARRTAEYIESEFDFPILICLSRENISRHEPVGESNNTLAAFKIASCAISCISFRLSIPKFNSKLVECELLFIWQR